MDFADRFGMGKLFKKYIGDTVYPVREQHQL